MSFPIIDLSQQLFTVNQHIEESGMVRADILAWLGQNGSLVETDYENYYRFESNFGFITLFCFDEQKISVITQTRR
jgi:hypothetical protein